MAVNICQPVVASGIAVGEPFVIETEQMQDGCLQIMHVDFVFDRLEAKFIGRSVNKASFHASAGQPRRETIVVMVAAIDFPRVGNPVDWTKDSHAKKA